MSELVDTETRGQSLDSIAESLRMDDLPTLVQNIGRNIRSHAREVGINKNVTILQSRFTPPQEAYDKGFISCGVMANSAAYMLKHLGYDVKLIHGEIPSTPTHAWFTVLNTDTGEWEPYDLTQEDASVTEDHKVKYIVDDWEEIRPEIEAIYKSNHPNDE